MIKQSLLIGALMSTTLLATTTTPAQAAVVGCAAFPSDISNRISGSIGCQISGTVGAGGFVVPGANNDSVSGGNANFANFTVNTEQFFGVNNWLFAGKSDEGLSQYFTPDNGSPTNGRYNLGNLFQNVANLANVMLIFKSGNDTSLVGYLLDNRVQPYQGSWTTPFLNPPFPLGNQNNPNTPASREVSHISVYYQTGTTVIPTPALLPGLIALGVGALRKQRQLKQEADV